MKTGAPDLRALESLASSDLVHDRAFVGSELRRHTDACAAMLYDRLRASATRAHAATRARIRSGTFDRQALAAVLEGVPLELRDHLVEEILDVAYPPLEASARPEEDQIVLDATSGVAEILFMLERSGLGPGKTFVDLGSGAGKVALLVALFTGARAVGLEIDRTLVAYASSAARTLGLAARADFTESDIGAAPLPSADVYYMYIPLIGAAVIAERLASIARERPFVLFSQALDLARFPWLHRTGAGSYWLEIYETA